MSKSDQMIELSDARGVDIGGTMKVGIYAADEIFKYTNTRINKTMAYQKRNSIYRIIRLKEHVNGSINDIRL